MNISRKDVEVLLQKAKRQSIIFLVLNIAFYAIAAGLVIAGICLLKPNNNVAVNLIYYGTMSLALGITFMVLRSVLCTGRIRALEEALKMFEGKSSIKVGEVDVRDVPSGEPQTPIQEAPQPQIFTQQDALIKEYEKLVEQGLITQEDFEKRKKEILGK